MHSHILASYTLVDFTVFFGGQDASPCGGCMVALRVWFSRSWGRGEPVPGMTASVNMSVGSCWSPYVSMISWGLILGETTGVGS